MAAKTCDNLIPYLAGELTEEEAAQFQKHLKHCSTCPSELKELQETWQMLGHAIDERQAPPEMKSEVMDFVFSRKKPSRLAANLASFKHYFSPVTAVVMIVLLIGCIGLFWNNLQLRETAMEPEAWVSEAPMLVTNSFILRSNDPSTEAQGMVYEIREGNEKKLVMVFQNMPETKGQTVYQAWLLYEGNRHNCGTFHVNENGRAVLTYRLPAKVHFEDIEITSDSDSPILKTL
ncbi:MAG TPA: anti-sigma factor [Bacillales bacterium]|nr:anti-sigma factor [Bacillales bacterium]